MRSADRKERTPLGPGREFDVLRALFQEPTALPDEVLVGPGDDCAVLDIGRLAVTCDVAVEDVHFRRDWLSPVEIGYRAAAAALSDLAAMAAVPVAVLVSYVLSSQDVNSGCAEALQRGVEEAAHRVGAAVVGGDLSRSTGPMVLDVVALGKVSRAILRSGARPGDELWVTGRLGASGAAVRLLERGEPLPDLLRSTFARPVPRIGEALWLAERNLVRACIDLSDGLAGDAGHLAAASGVGIILRADAIPLADIPDPMSGGPGDVLRLALEAGEDYELCFAAPAATVQAVAEGFEARFSIPLTRVGLVVEGHGVVLDRGHGEPERLDGGGFDHFAGGRLR